MWTKNHNLEHNEETIINKKYSNYIMLDFAAFMKNEHYNKISLCDLS
jgi:hypothetical protein